MTTPIQAAPAVEPISAAQGFRPLMYDDQPRSRFWFNDREIASTSAPIASYTSDDFRRELARVERQLYWLTIVSVAVAVIAVIAIIGVVIQAG